MVPRKDGRYSDECECGWRAYAARDQLDGWSALHRHLGESWETEYAEAANEKERVRLLTQGQNWDMP